jgi:hypothetical protein
MQREVHTASYTRSFKRSGRAILVPLRRGATPDWPFLPDLVTSL